MWYNYQMHKNNFANIAETCEMNQPTKKLLLNAKIKTKVHSELVDILYKQILHMLWAEAFAGSLLFFILWWEGDRGLLIGWAAFMIVLTGIPRYFIAHAYAHAARDKKRSKHWEIGLMALLLVTGLGWSFAGTVLLPLNNRLNESIVLFLLVGVAAAANPFYSPIKKMYAIFLIPTLFFSAMFLLIRGTNYSVFIGIALLTFGMLMLITSLISSELISKSLKLRFQNLELTKNLLKTNIRLESLASHDTLTQLPNRGSFYEKLAKTIAEAELNRNSFAILFLDLNKFKNINDSLGHDTGDQLLVIAAERLKQAIGRNDIACRLGGDEFILLLPDIANPAAAAQTAENVCKAFTSPISIKNNDLVITISVGISIYPKDGTDANTLIKKADIAMYQAKNDHKGGYQFYQ
jgi:diguanylate cyclase (GGDEF)-like protein